MKEKILIFLGGAVLGGIIATKLRNSVLKIERIREDSNLLSRFMALEKKLDKDEENLILKEGLKEGSEEHLKRSIELKENFILEGEKIAKCINGKESYAYCYSMLNLRRFKLKELKEELS